MKQSNLALQQDSVPEGIHLQDCPILPSQFFTRRIRTTLPGERRLLLAVLEEAVDSFCKSCGRHERRNQTLHREAEEWLFSDDRTWFLAFQNICDVLDIESDSLRERLAAWKSARLKKKVEPHSGRVYPLHLAG